MPVGDAAVLEAVRTALNANNLAYKEDDESEYMTRLTVSQGVHRAFFRVSTKGALNVQGPACPLKEQLQKIKTALENGEPLPGQSADIDKLLEVIRTQVPACDPVILAFLDEAIICYKAGALLSCAFMLGAASEKAISLLVQTFGDCIQDNANKENYKSKTNSKMISVRYDEFMRRFRSCKNRPDTPPLNQDIDTLLGTAFQFYRMTRNDVGHPEIVPNLARPVLHANIAQMAVYLEKIYRLRDHFRANGVVL